MKTQLFVALVLSGMCVATQTMATPSATFDHADAMIRDVDHLVQTNEQSIWHIDAEELAGLQTDILLVLCPASDELRTIATRRLKARADKHGDLKARWEANHRDLDAIAEPMRQHRALLLFESGMKRVQVDCPFWMPQKELYIEKHRPTRQWFVGIDGGGVFNILPASRPLLIGFGGSSRLSVGYGLSSEWVLKFGLEAGGAGLLKEGIEVEDVDVQFFGGLPVSLRRLWDIWFIESELGPIGVGIPWKNTVDLGGRTSFMLGFASAKLGRFQPWAGARISVDYLPSLGMTRGLVFRSGFRFGIDYR